MHSYASTMYMIQGLILGVCMTLSWRTITVSLFSTTEHRIPYINFRNFILYSTVMYFVYFSNNCTVNVMLKVTKVKYSGIIIDISTYHSNIIIHTTVWRLTQKTNLHNHKQVENIGTPTPRHHVENTPWLGPS